MSRWCDRSIHDTRHSDGTSGPLEVARLFGTLVAETILASVHVRAHRQAGHMDASDLIKALQNTLQGGGRPHMDNRPVEEAARRRHGEQRADLAAATRFSEDRYIAGIAAEPLDVLVHPAERGNEIERPGVARMSIGLSAEIDEVEKAED